MAESTLVSVTQDAAELQALREMASDPATPKHLKLGALKELARRREAAEPELAHDPLGQMRAVVERYCPEIPEMLDAPPDPMRDLDFQAVVGRPANPVLWEWAPYCPADPAQAERSVVSAVRRLKLGQGPYGPPESDELARRRRRRRRTG